MEDETPYHIERVNFETSDMFSRLSGERKTMSELFDTPFDNINAKLAWGIFDKMFYDQLFRDTKGDHESLNDSYTRYRSLQKVYARWPIRYYVILLKEKGIMDSVETPDGEVFFIRDIYKPSIKTLLTASPTLLGS